jgi:hypothetical protein
MASLAGWMMIVVSGLVLFVAFPGEYNFALLPEFIGSVGIPFAIAFAAFQYALAAHFRKARVLWLVTGLFVVGIMLGAVGRAIDMDGFFAEHRISYLKCLLCGGSCVSGLGFGIAIVRGWVYDETD